MILMVEDEKFHVHRVMLIVNSPVFKVMFKSKFKEATANEVPLPEKKANEVLDFLKQLYVQEREEITSKHFYVTKIITDRLLQVHKTARPMRFVSGPGMP